MSGAATPLCAALVLLVTLAYFLGQEHAPRAVLLLRGQEWRRPSLARRVLDEVAQQQQVPAPQPSSDPAYQVPDHSFYPGYDVHHSDIICSDLGAMTAKDVAQQCQQTEACLGFSLLQRQLDAGQRYCLKWKPGPLTPANETACGTDCMSRPSEGVYLRNGAKAQASSPGVDQAKGLCAFLKWGGICHQEGHECICAEIDDATGKMYYKAGYLCEFGYELVTFLPWTHYLHTLGLLRETVGAVGSEALHFYSPKHTTLAVLGRWHPCGGIPAHAELHDNGFSFNHQWLPPNFTAAYSTPAISAALTSASLAAAPIVDGTPWPNLGDPTAHRELLIIHNKFATEWNAAPVNYIDLPTLEALFIMLQDRYQVIYINSGLLSIASAHMHTDVAYAEETAHYQLNDTALLERYPKVLPIHHIVPRYAKYFPYNQLLFALHARCRRFISVQGGNSILASYFGGTNLIFFRHGADMNDFHLIYPHLANTDVHVANDNYTDLINMARDIYMK